MAKNVKRVKTTPDSSLMEDIGIGNFTVSEAIAELVANSFDWRSPNESVNIALEVSPEEIIVRDNGQGMTQEVLEESVILGRKSSIRNAGEARKGKFGLGMKTACANLGKTWTVLTRPPGQNKTLGMTFDLTSWSSNSGDSEFNWEEDLFELEDGDFDPFEPDGHGTELRIQRLRDPGTSVGAINALIGRAYKGHLESGDKITLNGVELQPPAYNLIEGSRIEINLPLVDAEGNVLSSDGGPWIITGWAGLDFKTHNDDLFGFNLYRRGQLIKAWDKSFFRVHLMTSRVIGEINLDFVGSNFHKKGFDEDSIEWKSALPVLREFLKPLATASGKMSMNKEDETRHAKALDGMRKAMFNLPEDIDGAFQENLKSKNGEELNQVGPEKIAEVPKDPVEDLSTTSIVIDGERILIGFEVIDAGEDDFIWDYLYDKKASELQAVINGNSSLFRSTKDSQLISIFAIADAVMKFLIIEKNLELNYSAEVRDRWITASLSERNRGS